VTFVKGHALRPGDEVAVIAPGGPFDRESFDKGLAVLATRYRPTFDDSIYSKQRYLAGNDERRSSELAAAIANPNVKAIFAARGGYGSLRVLPHVRFAPGAVKPLVGFSDITALHAAANAAGWVTVHGPVLTQLGKQPADVVARFFALLESHEPATPLSGIPVVDGVAEGPLLGGNLSVLTRLIGTPYFPDLAGAVLLIEDVGERPYRLDRMWTHLQLAGAFERVAGIALGEFTGCEEPSADYTSTQIVHELARAAKRPCAGAFRIGHGDVNQPVPLGSRVRLDASAGRLEFLEAAVT
jgi:muramoyltetrapeptide carboxypeptidase